MHAYEFPYFDDVPMLKELHAMLAGKGYKRLCKKDPKVFIFSMEDFDGDELKSMKKSEDAIKERMQECIKGKEAIVDDEDDLIVLMEECLTGINAILKKLEASECKKCCNGCKKESEGFKQRFDEVLDKLSK